MSGITAVELNDIVGLDDEIARLLLRLITSGNFVSMTRTKCPGGHQPVFAICVVDSNDVRHAPQARTLESLISSAYSVLGWDLRLVRMRKDDHGGRKPNTAGSE